jgi:hypothetical protein
MTRLLACAALLALSALPAHAQAYVGTWASQPAQCRNGQEVEDAPLIMKAKRYYQHETHCTFSSVTKSGAAWNVKASCQVEGDKQNLSFKIAVAGDTLTMDRRTLQRCK